MAVQVDTAGSSTRAGGRWYARSPDEVAAVLGVDPAMGLSDARAAELLSANGPNALPEEKPRPGWVRFLGEYRSTCRSSWSPGGGVPADQTGTLTMNQMTGVEVVSPTDRYTILGIGYGLEGKVHHAAGRAAAIEDATLLPYCVAATRSSSTARSSAIPPRAPFWCWYTRPGSTSTPPASGCPG